MIRRSRICIGTSLRKFYWPSIYLASWKTKKLFAVNFSNYMNFLWMCFKTFVHVWEKRHFRSEEQRGEKYPSNETFLSFVAQKATEIQYFRVWTSKNITLKNPYLKFSKLFIWFFVFCEFIIEYNSQVGIKWIPGGKRESNTYQVRPFPAS